jgi:hypothetical protein
MSERLTVLELIESGQISVEEALRRLEALDRAADAGGAEPRGAPRTSEGVAKPAPAPTRPRFVRVVWQIVFAAGVAVLAGGGLLLARAYGQEGTPGFTWGWVVFTLGLLVMGLGWWLRQAGWFTLRVREHDSPAFSIALPLPLGLVIWLLPLVTPFVPQLQEMEVRELILVMRDELREGRPLVIHVDEGENGDQVEVRFG